MFFPPKTVLNSDDESRSSCESDYDPLTAMLVYTQQDRHLLLPPEPQDYCTIITPATASVSPILAKTNVEKKRKWLKRSKPRGQKLGNRELKKNKHSVKATFGMAAMLGGDDTFITPKTIPIIWQNSGTIQSLVATNYI